MPPGAFTVTCSGSVPLFAMLKCLVSDVTLSRLMLKLSDLGETESLLEGVLLLSGSTNDCASAGRANAASKNNNEKLMHATDRVSDLVKRIDNFLPS